MVRNYNELVPKIIERRTNRVDVRGLAMNNGYKVTPGPSILELMGGEIRHARSGFYKSGLVLGFGIMTSWREGQDKPYHLLKAQVIKCKKDNEDPKFIRGVATILAILIDPYEYMARTDKFDITINYILSMED